MEQWEKDLNRQFGKSQRTKPITGGEIHRFVKYILKEERQRDKLQELIDYVNESKSNMEILNDYIYDQPFCVPKASDELRERLNMKGYKGLTILGVLEQHFKDKEK